MSQPMDNLDDLDAADSTTADTKTYFCSFCGKNNHEIDQLIAGPSVFICDECVELCMSIVLEKRTKTRPHPSLEVETGMNALRRDIEADIDIWIERLRSLKRRN